MILSENIPVHFSKARERIGIITHLSLMEKLLIGKFALNIQNL